MAELDLPVSPLGIAQHYGDLINGLVIDNEDVDLAEHITSSGIGVHVTNTLMKSAEDESNLAQETLAFATALSQKAP
jgi:LPPG:FO 2-phospho-L-lactate transferase